MSFSSGYFLDPEIGNGRASIAIQHRFDMVTAAIVAGPASIELIKLAQGHRKLKLRSINHLALFPNSHGEAGDG